ncbi:glycerophosphoryl diester phosphodiesterase [Aeromicrobium panaciterrae]|uniref:Glycerophosphoryl diester phosphodiesterase n=1 Tax=Aeromicrobium panaciterrae TaxID=363861 RepID=A0ABU1UP01_9ACTN|nr:glycerophosphodiester phosphodiesterase [Aeromicrobium panaciterrae]MDR7086912.1 glycerophosphoryl diester phosphodiesterase [Aeromicrobium panaciterrae]
MSYLDSPTPIAFAHRGGSLVEANLGIENSMASFTHAYEMGYRYLETDVHVSGDGRVFVFHDDTLERMTGNTASIASLDSEVLSAELLGGRERIPMLEELIKTFPDARFNIDLKSDEAVEETCAVIEDFNAVDRVCLASFEHERLGRIRHRLPGVATSASRREAVLVKFLPAVILRRMGIPAVALQMPETRHGIRVVTRRFVKRAHALGIQVHVWTIDDADSMNRLLDLGVDGLMTDRTDILKDVLVARGMWRERQ